MSTSDTTAILLFSRSAMEEASVKVFDPSMGKKGNSAIARKLIRHTAAIARKSQLPLITCFSEDQSGDKFGERLANAMEAVFAQGYDRVIAIGNDCPEISVSLLRDSTRKLDSHDLVLGPALDGGVYLIGMSKASYDRAQFTALPWQQEELQLGWSQYAAKNCNQVAWLYRLTDIDNAEDFRKALRALPASHLLKLQLCSILASKKPVYNRIQKPIQTLFPSDTLLVRGPPA